MTERKWNKMCNKKVKFQIKLVDYWKKNSRKVKKVSRKQSFSTVAQINIIQSCHF
jgi:hypothetical protein